MTDTTPTAYREHADPFALLNEEIRGLREDSERLKQRNEELRIYANRQRVEAAKGAAWILILAALAGFCIYGAARYAAFGEKARRNAEREASVYFGRTLSPRPVAIYCGASDPATCGAFWLTCTATQSSGARTIACCDDDNPMTNDGCVKAR